MITKITFANPSKKPNVPITFPAPDLAPKVIAPHTIATIPAPSPIFPSSKNETSPTTSDKTPQKILRVAIDMLRKGLKKISRLIYTSTNTSNGNQKT